MGSLSEVLGWWRQAGCLKMFWIDIAHGKGLGFRVQGLGSRVVGGRKGHS